MLEEKLTERVITYSKKISLCKVKCVAKVYETSTDGKSFTIEKTLLKFRKRQKQKEVHLQRNSPKKVYA